MIHVDDDFFGLFYQDSEEEKRRLKRTIRSSLAIPESGWRPPTDWPMVRDATWIAIDVETFDPDLDEYGPGWARGVGHIVGVSIAWHGGKRYFPVRHSVQTNMNMDDTQVFKYLQWVLGGTCPKVGANITYDLGWLRQEGIIVKGPLHDVQFAEALINETSKVSLEELGWKYLKRGKKAALLERWIMEAYHPPKTKWRSDIHRAPPTLTGEYAEDDAEMPADIIARQVPILKQLGVHHLYRMECDLIRLFLDMRFAGVSVDVPYAERLNAEFLKKKEVLLAEIKRICGFEVNVNASASLAKAFDEQGIEYHNTAPTTKHPHGQPSFTAAYLRDASLEHPFANLVAQVKNYDKLSVTFLQQYIMNASIGGKVFCSFHQMSGEDGGTRTGRLACSDPNLQNIPIRTDDGKKIRGAFIPDFAHIQMRDYDYSQIEYRMLAHFATGPGSDGVRTSFINDPTTDYHKFVGAMIKLMTGQDLIRGHIKNINFGSIYGVGVKKMCLMLGVPFEIGKALLDAYHTALPYVRHTSQGIASDTNMFGIVKTILGRISHFDEWEPIGWEEGRLPAPDYETAVRWWGDVPLQRAGTFKATNYKFQGSAAEFMKRGMLDCYNAGYFDEVGIPKLTVHDELLWSDHGCAREETWEEMAYTMENCITCRVPIMFEKGMGSNWMTAH